MKCLSYGHNGFDKILTFGFLGLVAVGSFAFATMFEISNAVSSSHFPTRLNFIKIWKEMAELLQFSCLGFGLLIKKLQRAFTAKPRIALRMIVMVNTFLQCRPFFSPVQPKISQELNLKAKLS